MESEEPITDPLASDEELLPVSASTSQRAKKIIRKRTRRSSEESNFVEEPKEKVAKKKKKGEVQITEDDDELRCSICTELFITAVTLTCSHTFCKYCIDFWRRNRTDCPICRTRIINSMSPTLILDNLIVKIIGNCSNEVKERRIKIIEERTAETAAHASNVDGSSERIPDFIHNSLEQAIQLIISRQSHRVRRSRTGR